MQEVTANTVGKEEPDTNPSDQIESRGRVSFGPAKNSSLIEGLLKPLPP